MAGRPTGGRPGGPAGNRDDLLLDLDSDQPIYNDGQRSALNDDDLMRSYTLDHDPQSRPSVSYDDFVGASGPAAAGRPSGGAGLTPGGQGATGPYTHRQYSQTSDLGNYQRYADDFDDYPTDGDSYYQHGGTMSGGAGSASARNNARNRNSVLSLGGGFLGKVKNRLGMGEGYSEMDLPLTEPGRRCRRHGQSRDVVQPGRDRQQMLGAAPMADFVEHFKGNRMGKAESPARQPAQHGHMGVAAQIAAQVAGDRAHIAALAADQFQLGMVGVGARDQRQALDMERPGGEVEGDGAGERQLLRGRRDRDPVHALEVRGREDAAHHGVGGGSREARFRGAQDERLAEVETVVEGLAVDDARELRRIVIRNGCSSARGRQVEEKPGIRR